MVGARMQAGSQAESGTARDCLYSEGWLAAPLPRGRRSLLPPPPPPPPPHAAVYQYPVMQHLHNRATLLIT